MKSKYEYIIKYSFRGGQGAFQMTCTRPLNSLKDINLLKEKLEKEESLRNICIDGYTLVSSKVRKRKFIK